MPWMLIAFLCAAYVFVGIAPVVFSIAGGNWIFIVLSVIAYVLNLALLSHAKKKDW